MPKHHCCAYNCTNSEAKKKDPVKYPEVASVTFHCFPSNNEKKQYAPGMSEQERRRRWIAACRLESLNVTRHTRITKANPVTTIFDFPTHLQRKEVKQRQDPEQRRLKNPSTTNRIQKASKPGQSKVREHNESVLGEEIGIQDLLIATPELHYNRISDHHLLLEKPQPAELHVHPKKIKDGLVYRDEAVQTELTAEQITSMEQAPFKQRDELKRDLFKEDVQRDDSSVKFYTGLPSLSCLLMLFDFLKPVANCMKYWEGKNKTRAETYQVRV